MSPSGQVIMGEQVRDTKCLVKFSVVNVKLKKGCRYAN